MIAFLALLFILLVIYALTKTKEGFNPMNTSPEHRINIPVNEVPSMLAPASDTTATVGNTVSKPASNGSIFPDCDVEPSTYPGMLPGSLPTAPYEQIAVGSPLPYQDTSLIKANRQQLINLLEMLKGFLAYEAQEIAERSDPTIQLPLQTARTDFHVLQMEVEVLNRNPGIQPTITLSHLNEIGSNLAFLQRQVRLIGTAGPIQGPIYEFTKPVEGFFGGSAGATTSGSAGATTSSGSAGASTSKKLKGGSARPRPVTNTIIDSTLSIGTNTTTDSKGSASAITGGKGSFGNQYESAQAKQMKAFGDTLTPDDNQYKNQYSEILTKLDKQQEGPRPTTTDTARNPKVEDIKVEKSETITIKQSEAEAEKAAMQKKSAQSLLDKLVPWNTPAGPSDKPSTSSKSAGAPFDQSTMQQGGANASVEDLNNFIGRLDVEILRLSASGVPPGDVDGINARMLALQEIKSTMEDLITEVYSKRMDESDIPVKKAELEKALPILGKPNQPLPTFIKKHKLPDYLSSLFPENVQNDPKITKEIGQLSDKYLDTLVNGISWQVKYTSPREAQAGGGVKSENFMNSFAEKKRKSASTIDKTGFPSLADLDNASNAKFTPMDSGLLITDRNAPLPSDAGRGPSHFDWMARSKEIEAQVRKRGLKQSDFGIMPPSTKVSKDFSWKGYARMICTRLQATMDPNLPVVCGCPPMDWPGWRTAK